MPLSLRLVSSSRANAFMTELLGVLAGELRGHGVDAQLCVDRFPPAQDGMAYVVVPHEFFATVPREDHPSNVQLARTIALATEQPGSGWFEHAVAPAATCATVADISTLGVLEWRRRGVAAEHLRLGYSAAWDAFDDECERDIDVIVLASINARRAHYLAGYAGVLAERETRLVLAPVAPKQRDDPGVFLSDERTALLHRSRIALNVRMLRPPYFEWLRAIQALSAGAVLVAEHSAGHDPLVAGEHFVSGSPENLGLLADALLRDPEELARLRLAGYTALRQGPSMAHAALRLAELAQPLADAPLWPLRRRAPEPVDMSDPQARDADADPQAEFADLAGQVDALGREVAALRLERRGIDPAEIVAVTATSAFADADPRITIAMTLGNQETTIDAAIASVAAQDVDERHELLILDDASTDASIAAAQAALERCPWLPAQLLSRRAPGGVASARNELLARARGEHVLMLDGAHALYPRALQRLVAALDAAPDALFAYGVVDCRHGDEPAGLRSFLPWDPSRPPESDAIDPLSLLRREAIAGLGGYRDDPRIHGRETHDLWRRIAAHGGRGEHVASFVGRHHTADLAMLPAVPAL